MKVKELIKKLQELPEEMQEKEFKACMGMSPECEMDVSSELYLQPEFRHVSYKGRPDYKPTGEIDYVTFDRWR